MSEKDQKLKTQIQKNHDLLGELQELSEAVHALKNDKAFQRSTEIIEEKEEVIHQLQSFLLENVKKHLETQYAVMSKAQYSDSNFQKQLQSFQQQAAKFEQ